MPLLGLPDVLFKNILLYLIPSSLTSNIKLPEIINSFLVINDIIFVSKKLLINKLGRFLNKKKNLKNTLVYHHIVKLQIIPSFQEM